MQVYHDFVSLNSCTGLTHKTPPPEVELSDVPPQGPPCFQAEGERETENFPLSHLVPIILQYIQLFHYL